MAGLQSFQPANRCWLGPAADSSPRALPAAGRLGRRASRLASARFGGQVPENAWSLSGPMPEQSSCSIPKSGLHLAVPSMKHGKRSSAARRWSRSGEQCYSAEAQVQSADTIGKDAAFIRWRGTGPVGWGLMARSASLGCHRICRPGRAPAVSKAGAPKEIAPYSVVRQITVDCAMERAGNPRLSLSGETRARLPPVARHQRWNATGTQPLTIANV